MYLYRLYDRAGALLYVGITNSPERRFAEHAADKVWWPEVAARDVAWAGNQQQALALERTAIQVLRPRYNICHNGRNPHRVVVTKVGRRPRRWKVRGRRRKGWRLGPPALTLVGSGLVLVGAVGSNLPVAVVAAVVVAGSMLMLARRIGGRR